MVENLQELLDPVSRHAMLLSELGWLVMLSGTVAFALFMLLAMCGTLLGSDASGSQRRLLKGGLALPMLALAALVVYALIMGEAFSQDGPRDALRIELQSKASWWEVRYAHERGRIVAHEIRVPVGRPVELVLAAADRFWGFRVPELAAQGDVGQGRAARVLFTPRMTGRFRVQGTKLDILVADARDFEDWLLREAAPSVTPTDPLLQDGRAAFFRGGCDRCHTIRGTAARGRRGPDLTHVAARQSLIVDALDHHLRVAAVHTAAGTGARAGEDLQLRAVAGYLASLK
jgi:cytochrome c oxidase subunit II